MAKVLSFFKDFFIILIVSLLLGELVLYLFPALTEKPPPYNTAAIDKKIGWRAKGNYSYEGPIKDVNEKLYPVKFTTHSNGFREWSPSIKDTLPHILFIGDSYTQSSEVSDDKTFYHYIKKELPATVSAYGMSGYGTLQELMILEEALDSLQPDYIVFQLCSNDFIDNYAPLELNSNYRVGLRRPYWTENGEIEYITPLYTIAKWCSYSKFLSFIYEKWRHLRHIAGWRNDNPTEKRITVQGLQYEPFQKSVNLTEQLLQKVVNALNDNQQILFFISDNFEPYQSIFENMCKKNDWTLLTSPAKKVEENKRHGKVVHSLDGYHWNELGHEIVGKALLVSLKNAKAKK